MVVIINYGMGNVASVRKALRKLNYECVITNDEEEIFNSTALILPGVGSFGEAMKNLNNYGLVDTLRTAVLENQKPILGICLGMQLLSSIGYEDGPNKGLNLIKGEVVKIDVENLPIPHIGWNDLTYQEDSLFSGVQDFNFYFVHSYYFKTEYSSESIATVDYGKPLTAMVKKDNIVGTQFHPEKSQESGLMVLKNFLDEYA